MLTCLLTCLSKDKQGIYFTIEKPCAAAPTYLQSKFKMLWLAKDYGLWVGKTAEYAHAEIKNCKSNC